MGDKKLFGETIKAKVLNVSSTLRKPGTLRNTKKFLSMNRDNKSFKNLCNLEYLRNAARFSLIRIWKSLLK